MDLAQIRPKEVTRIMDKGNFAMLSDPTILSELPNKIQNYAVFGTYVYSNLSIVYLKLRFNGGILQFYLLNLATLPWEVIDKYD